MKVERSERLRLDDDDRGRKLGATAATGTNLGANLHGEILCESVKGKRVLRRR